MFNISTDKLLTIMLNFTQFPYFFNSVLNNSTIIALIK